MRPCMRQLFLDIFSQIWVLIADLGRNLRSGHSGKSVVSSFTGVSCLRTRKTFRSKVIVFCGSNIYVYMAEIIALYSGITVTVRLLNKIRLR